MRLSYLKKYFIGGQAESEGAIVEEIFVTPHNISDITDFDFINYKIICAPKGAGKSTVINYVSKFYLSNLTYSLVIDPKSIDCQAVNEKNIPADKVNEASKQLLKLIAAKIGESINFAASKGDTELLKIYEEYSGNENVLSKIIGVLKHFTPDNVKNAVDHIISSQYRKINLTALTNSVGSNLKKTDKKFVLFIDNIDWAVEEKEPKFEYGTAWAIIEAAIDLANKINELAVVVSVRTDVWHTMTKVRGFGSSITDKIQDIIVLKNTDEDLVKIFNARLEKVAKIAGVINSDALTHFFDPEKIIIPGSKNDSRTWDVWLSKNSRFRPRDMIHLVQMLCKEAEKRAKSEDAKITDDDLESIYMRFANTRLQNIASEYRQIFPEIREAIDKFDQDFFSFNELVNFLKTLPSERKTIDVKVIKPNNLDDAIRIMRVLVMANFINPRADGKDGKYTHWQFEDDMDMIDPNHANQLQKYKYQVHPTFYKYVRRNSLRNIF